jgi:hypothetical protein
VVLTTGGTDQHSKDEKGINMEAINVCYRPIAVSSDSAVGRTSPSKIQKRHGSESERRI